MTTGWIKARRSLPLAGANGPEAGPYPRACEPPPSDSHAVDKASLLPGPASMSREYAWRWTR